MAETHYVARTVIEKVEKAVKSDGRGNVNNNRNKSELANIVVRSNSLADLQVKLGKHVELISDYEGDSNDE